MHQLKPALVIPATRFLLSSLALVLLVGAWTSLYAQTPKTAATAPATVAGTPSEAVRQFYKALNERRFRDALMMSAFRPAVEGLSPAEMEELRPYFEKIAEDADKIQISGEQISGDRASVFVKLLNDAPDAPPVEVQVRRVNGSWFVIFSEDIEKAVKREGTKYFFRERLQTQEQAAEAMLVRIASAQLVYSQQHNGQFADLPMLIKEKLLPADVLAPDSNGYRFHLVLGAGGKSYTAGAEPVVYGRTGMRSFFMDPTGLKAADTGGKPYTPSPPKK